MRLRYSALNKAFGMSEAYDGKSAKQKTATVGRQRQWGCVRVKTVGGKHEKVKDTIKHLCHHNLMPASPVAHVMKHCICSSLSVPKWPSFTPTLSPKWSLSTLSCFTLVTLLMITSQWRKYTSSEGSLPFKPLPLEYSPTLSDIGRNKNLSGLFHWLLISPFWCGTFLVLSPHSFSTRGITFIFLWTFSTEGKHLHSPVYSLWFSLPQSTTSYPFFLFFYV